MASNSLDLSHLPPTFLLPTHLSPSEAVETEIQLRSCGCPFAPSIYTASLFLGDINTSKRAAFELRGRGLKTTTLSSSSSEAPIRVVKLAWFTSSLAAGKLLPIQEYTVYTAIRTPAPAPLLEAKSDKVTADNGLRNGILERARRDAVRNRDEDRRNGNDYLRFARHKRDELVDFSMRQRKGIGEIMALSGAGEVGDRRPITPEFEDEQQARTVGDMPAWVRKNVRILWISCGVLAYRLPIFIRIRVLFLLDCFPIRSKRNPSSFSIMTEHSRPRRENTRAAAQPPPTLPIPSSFITSTQSASRVLSLPPPSACKPTPP